MPPRFKIRAELLFVVLAVMACCRAARAQDYYAQEKCSLCHIRESVFFDPKLAPPEKLKEFGEERMCGSCHNGAVRDSRAVLWRGAQHPVPAARGSKPCSWCHSPHSKGGWDVLAGSGVSITGGGDALCGGCHKGFASRGGPIHRGGFAAGGCRECHRAHGGTGPSLLREGRAQLCLRCHAAADAAKAGGHPVAKAAAGPAAGKQLPDCMGCHPVHGSAQPGSAAGSQCRRCHETGGGAAAKGPGRHRGAENCLECHMFHSKSAADGRGFRGKDMSVGSLCGKCHEGRVAESAKAARGKGTHLTGDSAAEGRLCFRCHRIHGSAPGTPLLVSGKAYSCLECHIDQNSIRETGGLVLAHPVFERIPKGRLDEAARTKRVVLGPKGEIVCRTCHAVHGGAKGTPLLAAGAGGNSSCFWCHDGKTVGSHGPGLDGKREVGCDVCHPVHGRKIADGDPWKSVCAECHPRVSFHKLGAGDRERPRPKDLPVFDRKGRQVGIGAISCPTCHQPHGAMTSEKRLHRRYDSSAFLCTACHAVGESVALTPHDLRGIAGKSLCEPCHLPHGGSPGLMWGLPTGGAAAAGEDACRSCHREKGMATPVPAGGHPMNVVVARRLPDELPVLKAEGQTAGTLTCSTCHDVHGTGILLHGGGTGKLLRARLRAGDGADSPGDACLPCHPKVSARHGGARCAQCHPVHRAPVPGGGCVDCHKRPGTGIAPGHVARGGGCSVCHKIHAGSAGDAESRCVGCHGIQDRISGTAHAELGGGKCVPCHPAHAELDNVTVKRKPWEEPVVPADLACYRCHRAGGDAPLPRRVDHPRPRRVVATNYGPSVTIESSVTMFSRFQEGGKLVFPLFDEKGGRASAGRLGCLTCHDPHAGPEKGAKGSAGAAYLRDPSNAFLSDLCSPCHKSGADEHSRKFHTLPRKEE